MSNRSFLLKPSFITSNSQNGVGRYVCQLQRIVFKFCKNNGSSRGMRDFIETELLHFAKGNPGIVVYAKPRRHRTASMTAEYLNGDKQVINCRNFSKDEVCKWLNLMKTQSQNREGIRLRKLTSTEVPSIQGPWTPYTFRKPELNLVKFPSEDLSRTLDQPNTATHKLLEMFKKQCTIDHLDNKRLE